MVDRVTTTVDSLANIVQTLSGGSMSGHLIARRDHERRLEEGEIFFVHGRIVAANVAGRVGVDALHWLGTWRDCTFSFRPSKESKHIPVLLSEVFGNSANAFPMKNGPESEKIPVVRKRLEEKEKEAEGENFRIEQPEALFPGTIPSRTEADEKALRLLKAPEYSRLHRHLFLLVDGHRSVVELTRLTARNMDDVVKFLRDLERLHIIHLPNQLHPSGKLLVRIFPQNAQ